MRILAVFFIGTGLLLADTTFVDWSTYTLKMTTSSRSSDFYSRSDIGTRFLSLLKNTYYDANQKVGDFLRFNFQKETQLAPYLQDFRKVDERFLTDGSQETDYELLLLDKILSLLLPKTEPVELVVPMCCPLCGQVWPQNRRVPEGVQLIPREENYVSNHTSIIIDCRNLNINPALFPKIKNDRGEDIYSTSFAQNEYLTQNGLVIYCRDIQEIYTDSRVGYNPLRITPIGVSGNNKTDPVISHFDAIRIHSSKNCLDLLARCRVVFIIGK